MKFLVIIFAFIVLIDANSMTGNFESCSFACSNENRGFNPSSQASSGSSNLIQGKSGPRGLKGERGHHGVKGEPGVDCDVKQIIQLKKQLVNLTENLRNSRSESDNLRTTVETLTALLRPQNCQQIKEQHPDSETGKYTIHENISDAIGRQVICDMSHEGSEVYNSPCNEILQRNPSSTNGVYKILVDSSTTTDVFCDMSDGGWTVIQRRFDGSTNFKQNFASYTEGFGNVEAEYWLGLENMYQLTKSGSWELYVKLLAYDGDEAFAKYSDFSIGAGPGYRLNIGSYSGTAGDSLRVHNGMKFSTEDNDQDAYSGNCAQQFAGSWWFKECHHSNINSHLYGSNASGYAKGMVWLHFKGHDTPLKETTMLIRKLN